MLDFVDDPQGGVLRQIFPTNESVPAVIKEAHLLSVDERAALPDDAFALVMLDDQLKIRKYANIDAGNTALNLGYFLAVADQLPAEVQQKTAQNFMTACAWYGLPSDASLGKLANPIPLGPETTPATPATGRVVPPSTAGGKVAAMDPYVDTTNLRAPVSYQQKRAQHYALSGRYPIDTAEQVKTANEYFTEWGGQMDVADRHEYCTNVAARAAELGVKLASVVERYGQTTYAPDWEIDAARDMRLAVADDAVDHQLIAALYEKRAQVHPEVFAAALHDLDQVLGFDRHYGDSIVDPYYGTFGHQKTAEEMYSWISGGDRVDSAGLVQFAAVGHRQLHELFGEEFAKAFCAKPVVIFKSLPEPQKKLIAHMVADLQPTGSLL